MVSDDGIGMAADVAAKVLEKPENEKNNGLSKIGIYNIHERIRRVYGKEYGLSVESYLERGTVVYGIIPYIQKEQKNDTSDDC